MLSFELYDDFDQLEVRETYAILEREESHLLNTSYIWVKTWWETFREQESMGRDKNLHIIRVLRDDIPCAMFSLITYNKNIPQAMGMVSLTILGICGDSWGATFEGILGKLNVDETRELMSFVRSTISYDQLQFSHIPVDSPLMQVISHRILLSACPMTLLGEYRDYDHFVKDCYSKKLRQNIRTGNNHATKNGHRLTSRVVPLSEVNFADIKRLSVSKLASGKHSIYLEDDKEKFVKRLLKVHAGNVVMVECDGKPAAYRLNFFVGKKKYCFDASYDRSYDRYEIGIQSLAASIHESFENVRSLHCEGAGIDSYKLKFLKRAAPIYILTEAGNSLKGRLMFPFKLSRLKKLETVFKKELVEMEKKYSLQLISSCSE